MANIHEIAKMCGISYATVSRVLNNHDDVSHRTRARVLKAIDTLGYVPNRTARSLKNRESRIISLIFPNNLNPLHNEIASRIEASIRQHGYELMLGVSEDSGEIERRYIQVGLEGLVDGMFLSPFAIRPGSSMFRMLRIQRMPLVALHQITGENELDYLTLDEYQGAYQAIDYLLGLGHRRIAFVAGVKDIYSLQDRINAIQDCFRAHGLAYDPKYIFQCDNTVEASRTVVHEILARKSLKPSALFVTNDFLTLGVYKALAEAGKSIPGDISVAGFDNIFMADYMCPALTTVSFDKDEFARTAVDFLVNRIHAYKGGKKLDWQQRTIQPRIIIRESCAAPK